MGIGEGKFEVAEGKWGRGGRPSGVGGKNLKSVVLRLSYGLEQVFVYGRLMSKVD